MAGAVICTTPVARSFAATSFSRCGQGANHLQWNEFAAKSHCERTAAGTFPTTTHHPSEEVLVKRICCIAVASALIALAANSTTTRAALNEGAHAYIIWPQDGAVIPAGKFWLRMGLSGAGIAPAGIDRPNTGHHHVIIDSDLPPAGEPIPNDKKHLHFGAGQTEARIELPPGRHTIQLILGDADHIPQNPPIISKKITVIVPQ